MKSWCKSLWKCLGWNENESEQKAFFERQKYLDNRMMHDQLRDPNYTENFDELGKYLNKTVEDARARAAAVENLLMLEKRAEIRKKYFPSPMFDYR